MADAAAREATEPSPGAPGGDGLGLLDQAPVPMIIVDRKGTVVVWNECARRTFGLPAARVVGRRLVDLASGTDSERALEELVWTVCGGGEWEGDAALEDGAGGETRVRLRCSVLRSRSGAGVGAICVAVQRRESLPDGAELGARIARARKEAGLTQRELAERLGVTRRSLQGYEAGRVGPYRHLTALADILGRPVSWFLPDAPETQTAPSGNELRLLVREEIEHALQSVA